MKRVLSAVLTGCAALTLLIVIQGCGVLGGPPTGVAVSAGPDESDSTVLVSWTTPAEGSPDKYQVYFRPSADTGYTAIGETTATSYAHNPHGVTGQYKVAALFGADAYEAAEKPTTVPAATGTVALFEINADSSRCGFGWSRDSGIGKVYSMIDSASCAHVDFYMSDLQAGFGSANKPYIVSPHKADSIDSGAVGIVPRAAWRVNGFSSLVTAETVPSYKPPPSATYFIYSPENGISGLCYIGCYTASDTVKHYAFIRVDSVNVASGQIWLQTWYQLVPGLRLIRH